MSVRIATLLALGGCAMNYAGNVPATGEPLQAQFGPVWRQGGNPVDEQDFYRIAGDKESYEQIESARSRGVTYNRIGLVLAVIGASALIVGSTINSHVYGGGVLMPIGGIMAYYGKAKAEQRPHISLHHASEIADRYNAHVGTAP